jgi:diaminopimelate decarboxylase
MDHFLYRDGMLHAEDLPLEVIASEVGTPFYCYSTATLERHFTVFRDGLAALDPLICYAVKANSNLAVLATLARLGAGADVVSEGEFRRALAAGIPGKRIIFSGVGKTADELAFALSNDVRQINVESEPELEVLDAVASGMGVRAPVSFRVNPDVDAKTHEKISTGKAENKFGIAYADAPRIYARAAAMQGIDVVGIDMHIGSQLTDLEPFREAYTRMRTLVERLEGQGIPIPRLDIGGGLGVPYERTSNEMPPLPTDYGKVVSEVFAGWEDREFECEPGRLIAANAGVLVAKVIYVKRAGDRRFLILDAAMNDLIRPALYDAYHEIVPVAEPRPGTPTHAYDVVGPICESGDTFAKARNLPELEAGDLIAFRSAGAYGAVMASEYNTRPPAPEVIVRGDEFALARPRLTYDDMLGRDKIPGWLDPA